MNVVRPPSASREPAPDLGLGAARRPTRWRRRGSGSAGRRAAPARSRSAGAGRRRASARARRPASRSRRAARSMKPCACARARGELDLLAGRVGLGVGDVLGDGGAEQEGVVGDEGDLRAQRGEVDLAQVGAVDRDRSPRSGRRGGRAARPGWSCPSRSGRRARRRGPASTSRSMSLSASLGAVVGERRRRASSTLAAARRAAAGRRAGSRSRGSRSRISNSRLPEAIARCDMPSAMPSIRIGPISMIR